MTGRARFHIFPHLEKTQLRGSHRMTFGRDVLDHTKEKSTEVCLTGFQSTEHVLTMFIQSVFKGDNYIE